MNLGSEKRTITKWEGKKSSKITKAIQNNECIYMIMTKPNYYFALINLNINAQKSLIEIDWLNGLIQDSSLLSIRNTSHQQKYLQIEI